MPPDVPQDDSGVNDPYKVRLPEIEEKEQQKADPKLALKPIKVLRAIVTGNGIEPRNVTLGEQKIKTVPFTGITRLKLSAKTTKTIHPGKDVVGDAVPDQQALYAAVENHIRGITSTPKMRERVLEVALKRPDKGFGVDGIKTGFHEFDKTFVMRTPCPRCNHTGKSTCPTCQGKKSVICPICRGQQETPCPKCRGAGNEHDGSACKYCNGRRRLRCTHCGGDGLLECKPCIATGFMRCEACAGSAWSSTVLSAKIEATLSFALDRTDMLPPDLVGIINGLGPKLVDRTIAEIEVTGVLAHVENKQIPTDEILISYKGRIPFGPIRFAVNGQSIGATLYGYHGELISCPDFLEEWGKDSIVQLKNAAQNRKEAQALLPGAAKLRFIRDALQASLMGSRRKAIELYRKRYPYGLSDLAIRDLMKWSDAALQNASIMQRIYGTVVAFGITVMVSGCYYTLDIPSMFQKIAPAYFVEFILLFILIAFSYTVPRLMGAIALRRLFGKTISVQKITNLMPRTGLLEWLAVLTTPVTMAAMAVIITIFMPVSPPFWLEPLLPHK